MMVDQPELRKAKEGEREREHSCEQICDKVYV